MIPITLINPYYQNPGMVLKQIERLNSFDKATRKNIEYIVVDDGSPIGQRAEEVLKKAKITVDFKLFRIIPDMPWNWREARNIGAFYAKHEWLLLTDIDHMTTQSFWDGVHSMELDPKKFYIPDRVQFYEPEKPPRAYKRHPNSYLMAKKFYWDIGGYDEIFAGAYGSDGMYRRLCEAHGQLVNLPYPLELYSRDVIPDASTRNLPRKDGRDPNALNDIREYKQEKMLNSQVFKLPFKRVL
ncbi:MAG: glycosyltransferase family A protein [Smithella sp.]